jgi:hypothetical protein
VTDIIPIDTGTGAKTHVLIIGVGEYLHLPGGAEPVPELETMGLGQLTSTVASAIAISNWILHDYRNDAAPLASVQVLLSPSQVLPIRGRQIPVDRASLASVRSAFSRWKNRADTNPDNVALFFFSGHGVEKETLALLLDDFGSDPNSPYFESINWDSTYDGMRQCNALLQVYWIDSCRSITSDGLKKWALNATTLVDPEVRASERSAPVIHATATNARAYGREGQATQFTKALLASLAGLGSEKRRNRWVITPSKLFEGVGVAMRNLAAAEAYLPEEDRLPDQKAVSDGEEVDNKVIADVKGVPEVPVRIGWNPEASAAHSVAELKRLARPRKTYTSSRSHPWACVVPAGSYRLRTTFEPPFEPMGDNDDPELLLLPPGLERVIEARQ